MEPETKRVSITPIGFWSWGIMIASTILTLWLTFIIIKGMYSIAQIHDDLVKIDNALVELEKTTRKQAQIIEKAVSK